MLTTTRQWIFLLGVVAISVAGGLFWARCAQSDREAVLADAFLTLGVPKRALEAFEVLHADTPDDALAEAGLALAHFRQGQRLRANQKHEESVNALREAVALRGDVHYFHIELGMALHTHGRPDLALAEFREAARLDPKSVGAHLRMFSLLLETDQTKEAEQVIERLIELQVANPGLREAIPNFYLQLAAACESAGDTAGAAKARKRAEELSSR